MKIEDTVTSVELSKELIKAGISTETCLCWVRNPEEKYQVEIHDVFCYEMACLDPVPCYTVAELGVMLGEDVMGISQSVCNHRKFQLSYANNWFDGVYDREAEARGRMLLYLLKYTRLTTQEVNMRLKNETQGE